jgi:predicted lipoprotein with Yx(FWY)xxD motif
MGTQARGRTAAKGKPARIAGTIAAAAGTALLVAACSSSSSSPGAPKSSAAKPSSTGSGTMSSRSGSASPSASGMSAAPSGTAALMTERTMIGTVLADSRGFTVYEFTKDHGTTSACTGACAVAWPPVTGTPRPAAGMTLPGMLGTITRPGGVRQATFDGHPLYTFKGDTAPGDVKGNGLTAFGGKWYAITVAPGTMAPSGAVAPSGTASPFGTPSASISSSRRGGP